MGRAETPWEWARGQAQEDGDTEQEAENVHRMFLASGFIEGDADLVPKSPQPGQLGHL